MSRTLRKINGDVSGLQTVLGLNRFDGLKFTTYKSTNSKLGNDALNTLLYNEEEDELWIGSNSGLYTRLLYRAIQKMHTPQKILQSTMSHTWLLLLMAEYGLSVTQAK